MYFPSTFPLYQQDPVFIFRNYLFLMSMVDQSLHTSHYRGQRGRNFLLFQGRQEWASELRSVNQTLLTLDFGLWVKWLRDGKRVQRQWPVCGSASAPASVLTFAHTRFCSPPINSGDSQISFQRISFLLLLAEQQWPIGFCCLPLKNSDGKRIYLSHYPAGVRSRRHCPHPQFTDWELGLRGPECCPRSHGEGVTGP